MNKKSGQGRFFYWSTLKLISYLFFTASWLLPNHYPPWVNFHSESFAFLSLGFLFLALLRSSPATLAIPALAMAALTLAFVPWVQHAAGLIFYAGDAFMASFYSVGLAVAIVLGYAHSSKRGTTDGTNWLFPAYVLLVAALVSSLLAILQWLSLTDSIAVFVTMTDVGDRAMANLAQPNQLGTLLLMGLLVLVFLFELFKTSRWLLIVASIFLTWALVLTESRSAIFSAIVVAGFLAYKVNRSYASGQPLRLHLRAIVIWLVGFFLAIQMLPLVNMGLLLHGERGVALLESNGRLAIWMQALSAIRLAPWAGYGWNQTPVAQAAGALYYPGNLAFSNAHNIVLDLLAWIGVPLGLLVALACIYWLYSRAKLVKSTQAIYAMAMLLPILVHSMLEFPFAYAYFLLMAGLLVGVVEGECEATVPFQVSTRVASLGLVLMTTVGIYSAYEYLQIEEDYRVARFENLKVGHTPDDYARPQVFIHTQLGALLGALRQPAVRSMNSAQMNRLHKVSLRYGLRPLVFRYALALGLNGEPVAAARQMQIFRGMFGERAYQKFKTELRSLQAEKYPELAAVTLP